MPIKPYLHPSKPLQAVLIEVCTPCKKGDYLYCHVAFSYKMYFFKNSGTRAH